MFLKSFVECLNEVEKEYLNYVEKLSITIVKEKENTVHLTN